MNDQPGFFTMPRGWRDNPVFGSVKRHPLSRADAWVWLVERAVYRETKVRILGRKQITLARGQWTASIRHLGDAWGWDTMKASRFISLLQQERMIETGTETGQLVITICGYGQNWLGCGQTDTDNSQERDENLSGTETVNKKEESKKVISPPIVPPPYEAREGGDGGVDQVLDTIIVQPALPGVPVEEKPVKTTDPLVIAKEMVAIWNEHCEHLHLADGLPKARKSALVGRYIDTFGKDMARWRGLCERIGRSQTLREKDWFNLDWALKPTNAQGLLEGKYLGRGPQRPAIQGRSAEDCGWDKLDEWDEVLRFHKDGGRWFEHQYGPPPGDPYCRAPKRLLEKYGLPPTPPRPGAVRAA